MKFDFSRLNWPQVALLLGIVAGIVAFFAFTPSAVLIKIPWQAIVVALIGGGGVASSFLGHVVKRDTERRERSSDPDTTRIE